MLHLRICFLIVFFVASCTDVVAQTLTITPYKSEAQVKVYISKYKSDADLIVFKTKYKSEAEGYNSGIWYFCQYPSEAQKKIFFTNYSSDADLIICYTDYKSEAGWQTKSKERLMK